MNATHKRLILGCLFLSTLVFTSCWGRDPNLPELVPVSGTVTLGGRPLPDALVRFVPVGETRGSVGSGRTDAQGKYELYNNRAEPGTAVGEYRVTIELVPRWRDPRRWGRPGRRQHSLGRPGTPESPSPHLRQ